MFTVNLALGDQYTAPAEGIGHSPTERIGKRRDPSPAQIVCDHPTWMLPYYTKSTIQNIVPEV
jgi:hypothetical protein